METTTAGRTTAEVVNALKGLGANIGSWLPGLAAIKGILITVAVVVTLGFFVLVGFLIAILVLVVQTRRNFP